MKLSFSHRIFGGMFLVILFTAISVIFLFSYYFKNQSEHYHEDRLKRKEDRIIASIENELDEFPKTVTVSNIVKVLENRLLGISNVNNQKINIFDLNGELLLSTESEEIREDLRVPQYAINALSKQKDRIDFKEKATSNEVRIEGYRYLHNIKREVIAIVHLPYFSNNEQFEEDQNVLIWRFVAIILGIFLIGAIIAWVMSNQITKRLKSIALKLKHTQMNTESKPIAYKGSDEVKVLVDSYNEMLYRLKGQTALLAVKEREAAWRDMAKQVAHEVKNPLTPMRLMIQNFKRRYDPYAENNLEKVNELSNTLLHQIDTISSIAEAFSSFAKMPEREDQVIDVVEETKICLNVYRPEWISFESSHPEIFYKFDKSYLTRIITNLAKNAIQSIPDNRTPQIKVSVEKTKTQLIFRVQDNGLGIPEEQREKIFVPKFTTKSSGMGLGLPMVKQIVEDYNGSILFDSTINIGTTFTILFPRLLNQ